MTGTKKFWRITVSVLLLVCVISGLAACSKNAGLVGEYNGTAGSYLKLDEDGTCIYAYEENAGTGKWEVKDNVIYIRVSNIRLPLYGNLEEDQDGFLLQSELSSWNDEYFRKSK